MLRKWKHRTRVYKLGTLWSWKCYGHGCHGDRFEDQLGAFLAAESHAFVGGYIPGEQGKPPAC